MCGVPWLIWVFVEASIFLIREYVVGTCRQIMRHFVQSPPAKKLLLFPGYVIKASSRLLGTTGR